FALSAAGTVERCIVSALGILKSGLRKCFDRFLDECEELVGHRAVDHAMVEGDREVGAGTNGDSVLAVRSRENLRPLLDRTDPENRYLRLIDYRRAHQRAENARVGDGERAFLNFLGRQLLGTCAGGEIVERTSDA